MFTGSGSWSDYDGDYFDDANQHLLKEDNTIIADILDKKVDIFEQPEETTPAIKMSRVFKQMFLKKNNEDLPDITSKESPHSKSSSSSVKTSLPWIVAKWVPA